MNQNESQTNRTPWPPPSLIAYYLSLMALWVAAFLPEARLWGINWYRYFGWPGQALLLVIGLVVPWLVERWTGTGPKSGERPDGRRTFRIMGLLTVLVFGMAFVFLAAQTHFLGDGYQVLSRTHAAAGSIKPWDAAIWAIQHGVYEMVGGEGEPDALLALRFISIGSGLILLVFAAISAGRLFDDLSRRVFFLLSVATGGYSLLYFGYVENYPPFVTLVMLAGLIGVMAARGRCSAGWLLVPLVPAVALHPFGVSLLPAVAYLLMRRSRAGLWVAGRPRWQKVTAFLAGVAFLFAVMAYFWQHSLFFRFSLVPPATDRFTVEGYTLFSLSHVMDLVNLLFMLCPGLLIALAASWGSSRRELLSRPDFRFLGLTLATALFIVFFFNPRLGMPRDWDLLSFVGVPLVLLCSLNVAESWRQANSRTASWLMIALALLLLVPRAVSQAIPETSIAVFDYFASLDIARSGPGRFLLREYLLREGRDEEAERRSRQNAIILPQETLSTEARRLGEQGRFDEARKKLLRAIAYDPTYHYAWSNLGVVYQKLGQYDSAIACLRIADGLNPYGFTNAMKLAGTYWSAGDDASAEAYWREAARLIPDDLESRRYLLRLLRRQERWNELDSLLEEVTSRDSLSAEILEPIARRQLESGDSAAAEATCRKALELGLDTADIVALQKEFPILRVVDAGWSPAPDGTRR